MTNFIEKGMLLGLGVLTLTRDKVAQAVNNLVEEGEVQEEEAANIIDKLVARGEEERQELRRLIREELDKARASVPLATRKDIEVLSEKIDALSDRLDDISNR